MRVLIADDHGVVRGGLRLLLDRQPDMEVVGEAADGAEAVARALAQRPDLAILDVAMPKLTGLQAAREIKLQAPDIDVLMLSMHDDERYLFEALKAGASGYVLKHEADQALVDAVDAVGRGEPFLTNAAQRSLVRAWMADASTGPREPLTPREQEVLKLIAEAHTNREIGAVLHLVGEDGRVPPGQPPAQARHARPRRARPLRDPARPDRALAAADARRARAAATIRRVPARVRLALMVAASLALLAALLVVAFARGGDASAGDRWAGSLRPPASRRRTSALRDQDGREVSLRALRGQVVVLTFLYTHCQDTCPVTATTIRGALDDLGHDVPALAVSVDPAGDTPASARRFLLQRRLTHDRMRFLLGRRAQLAAGLARLRHPAAGPGLRPLRLRAAHRPPRAPAHRLPGRPAHVRGPGARRAPARARAGLDHLAPPAAAAAAARFSRTARDPEREHHDEHRRQVQRRVVPVGGVRERARRSCRRRQQPEPEAGEGDHDGQHPDLRAHRVARLAVDDERAVVGEHEPGHVAGDERGDLEVPDRVAPTRA